MKRASNLIVLTAICLNLTLAVLFRVFEIGREADAPFYLSGGSGYELLTNQYTYVFLLLLGFFVLNLFKKEVLYNIPSAVLLIWTVFPYRLILQQKILFANNTDAFTGLMRNTLPLDLISILFTITLLIIQILIFRQAARDAWLKK